ncbi:MAG: DUF2393 family protein [Sulfuricurvum sp.]|nr:DUF2393 family protein [Sulfuricurvum sp.]MDD5387054.1 DUF2393 family protein [Sulfuricurvum sp.]
MKTQLLHFIDTLALYDYLLFGGILFFFFLFLILAVLLHHKLTLAITLVLTAFLLLIGGPFGGYMLLHKYLYKHTITLSTVQDLEYTEALVLKGDINNTSQQTFKECTLYFGVSKVSSIKILNDKIYPYLPFRRQTLTLTQPVKPNSGETFKLLIEPFSYPKKFSVTAWGICR